jgi:hypothetical protein
LRTIVLVRSPFELGRTLLKCSDSFMMKFVSFETSVGLPCCEFTYQNAFFLSNTRIAIFKYCLPTTQVMRYVASIGGMTVSYDLERTKEEGFWRILRCCPSICLEGLRTVSVVIYSCIKS